MAKSILIHTPEGVDLELEIASLSRRIFAFLIDISIMMAIALGVFLVAALVGAVLDAEWSIAALIIIIFLLRNFYFTFFEIIWSGRTVGKRAAMIKVVDVKGKPLSATAIFLRNVTRDVELFLPIQIIIFPEMIWPNAPWWMSLIASLWVLIFAFYPFLNKNRYRIGDLIAGTMVASVPKPKLADDLSEIANSRRFVFSHQQLDMYGVFELQTLETLLHRNLDDDELLKIAIVISDKIGIEESKINPPRPFLEALYSSLRERHENRLMFGDVQQVKKEGRFIADENS